MAASPSLPRGPSPHGRNEEQMLLWVRFKKGCLVPINPHKSIINSGQKQRLANKKRTAELP